MELSLSHPDSDCAKATNITQEFKDQNASYEIDVLLRVADQRLQSQKLLLSITMKETLDAVQYAYSTLHH